MLGLKLSKIIFQLIFLVTACAVKIMAQSSPLSAGNNASSASGSVSYSVGQVVYLTQSGNGNYLVEGVQQPYEISVSVGFEYNNVLLQAIVFPNPTSSHLLLQIAQLSEETFYELINTSGQIIDSQVIESAVTKINTENIVSGVYYLRVKKQNQIIKTFKVIKN